MTDRERYTRAFDTLHASRDISLEVTMKTWNIRKTVIVCACVLALLGAGITAYALTGGTFFGWGRNFEVTIGVQEDGKIGSARLHTDQLTKPVVFEDDRMVFIVNGEHIDITEQVSMQTPFQYRYTDEQGIEHLWLIGLNSDDPKNYGFAEFLFQDGEMLGGYSACVNIQADGSSMPWLDDYKPF